MSKGSTSSPSLTRSASRSRPRRLSRFKFRVLPGDSEPQAGQSASDSLNISERRTRWVACLLGRTRGHGRQDILPSGRRINNNTFDVSDGDVPAAAPARGRECDGAAPGPFRLLDPPRRIDVGALLGARLHTNCSELLSDNSNKQSDRADYPTHTPETGLGPAVAQASSVT